MTYAKRRIIKPREAVPPEAVGCAIGEVPAGLVFDLDSECYRSAFAPVSPAARIAATWARVGAACTACEHYRGRTDGLGAFVVCELKKKTCSCPGVSLVNGTCPLAAWTA